MVVGYDFSTAADDALLWAASLARQTSAHLAVVHVVDTESDDDPALDEVRTRLADVVRGIGADVSTQVVAGAPVAERLVRFADETDADALVVAMADGSAVRRWILGSVAEEVLHKAHCPVIAYRADDT
jgi:nucleotide-binding universal stress UspA family protein